ncbi:hypothetical protein ABBQ32_000382 [Trebouxia sp. C0010 RCD-2024]
MRGVQLPPSPSLGSLSTNLSADRQQHVSSRRQHRLTPGPRSLCQTAVTCLITDTARSLHERCARAFVPSYPQKRKLRQGSAVSYQPTFGQRVTHQTPARCSASAVDQFGRSNDASLQSGMPAILSNVQALYQFSRPHTMLGTFISICSVSLLAMGPGDYGSQAAIGLLQALIPALLMNICIVGMNQIFDVDIDKVNKPYLPLASGDWTLHTGISVAVSTGLVAVLLGLYIGSAPLLATLVGSLLLGIAYSVDLPFLRWKKYPVLAMGCILSVRAIMVQLGFYFHMQQALGSSRIALTWPLLCAICFMLVFSVVIALFKDIPDVKGDSQANVKTLSVRLGVKRVFWACIILLELAYAGAIGLGALSQVWWSKVVTVGVHFLLGAFLFRHAQQVDLQDAKSITSSYMLIWKLFYSEYLLIPFFR